VVEVRPHDHRKIMTDEKRRTPSFIYTVLSIMAPRESILWIKE
jgi:hypothetical protein